MRIPPEILRAYYPEGVSDQLALTGGEINLTWLIIDIRGKKTVLQRLNHATDDSKAKDYQAVSAYLQGLGWEMASLVLPREGGLCVRDSAGKLWRSFSYLEGQGGHELQGNLEASVSLGGLLGKLHLALSTFDYTARSTKPDFQDHFQDTQYYIDRLEQVSRELPGKDTKKLAQEMIVRAREVVIASVPVQLIHGDPRIANTICRQGLPFTFIDWDTLMEANPLVDVGDLLQSLTHEALSTKGRSFSVRDLDPVIEAYYLEAKLDFNEEQFREKALAAGEVIALNGGLRHLIDCVEDYYFGWDAKRFKSRLEFNLYAGRRQWRTYQAIGSYAE